MYAVRFVVEQEGTDAFVTKLHVTGMSPLLYSTYLGGSGADAGNGIALDGVGNAYVTGGTTSSNFPTTTGAFDTSANGSTDAFVTKLNPAGSSPLLYSTYLGGSGLDQGNGIALDGTGNAYVTGGTNSSNFPTTPNADDTSNNGALDVFVTKFNAAGSALLYSTYLGGSVGEETGFGIAVDGAGAAYVTGITPSANFPTTTGAFDTTANGGSDAFVTKLIPLGPPTMLTLDPKAATNPVDTEHCVTATVKDANGQPVPGVEVVFTVTGSVNTSGTVTTGNDGKATFCYQGPELPGADAIRAFADSNSDGDEDPGEPFDTAAKTWILPVSTPGCEIKITNGGWIIANNGDRASFGGNAKVDADGNVSGQEEYQDHGPAAPMNVHGNVLAVVCDTTTGTVFGQATIDGTGSHFYRIDVADNGEPGKGNDTYRILLDTGYDSGVHLLEGGNVQIKRTS